MNCCNCGGSHSDGFKGGVLYQETQVVIRVKRVVRLSFA